MFNDQWIQGYLRAILRIIAQSDYIMEIRTSEYNECLGWGHGMKESEIRGESQET